MIDIPYNQKLIDRNEAKFGQNDGNACIICSAQIKNLDNHKLWVRVLWGTKIGTEQEAKSHPDADMGYYPIGKDCLANNPQVAEYVQDSATIGKPES